MASSLDRARRALLERLYRARTRRELASRDPVHFLHAYDDPLDREVVGLIVSSLSYGRLASIARSVSAVLGHLGSPRELVRSADRGVLERSLGSFCHRFTTGDEVIGLIAGMREALRRFGSLRECFLDGLDASDRTTWGALQRFVRHLDPHRVATSLLPDPARGSACKRLHLFLRWMVRCDEVDPGGWEDVGAWRLIVPLDTHMHRLGLRLGLTARRTADRAAACEVTEGLRALCPEDPARYDFALTHLAIACEGVEELVAGWHAVASAGAASEQGDDPVELFE